MSELCDTQAPLALISRCPDYAPTPLHRMAFPSEYADEAVQFFIKDERTRMKLGSFKALGAAYVIAHMAQNQSLTDVTFVTASAGNHGLSVAAGARIFGARATIYLAQAVPESFAERLRIQGADVVRAGGDYETSMAAAQTAAEINGWTLLSDSSWNGYTDLPHRLMQGYLVLAAESTQQMATPPTHIFLQAGGGGLAGACAAHFRSAWGDGPKIIIVEPEAAHALYESIQAGQCVSTRGPTSTMGRLDCKEPSLIALNGLARDADHFMLISDTEVETLLPVLAQANCATPPSGGAGLATALRSKLPPHARCLCILSEQS